MGDAQHPGDEVQSPTGSTDAYRAARAVVEEAERMAAAILEDSRRQARAREMEADLLVAKARRLLEVAEQKAAAIVAVAQPSPATVVDLTDHAEAHRVVAPLASQVPRGSLAARIDQIVAAAVAQAVDEALPGRTGPAPVDAAS